LVPIQLGLGALGEASARIAEMTKPCPILGWASTQLDPMAEAIITTQLDQHLRTFHETGQSALMPDASAALPHCPSGILTIFGIPEAR